MRLLVEYLDNYDKNWGELGYKHADDSGFDLRAAVKEPITIKAGTHALIPNGIKLQIESDSSDYEIQVRPRSGLASKSGISVVNTPGTIDYGYRGELKTILINLGHEDFIIQPGDRIAQAVVCPILHLQIVPGIVSDNTERSSAGFGSTGGK